MSDDFRDALELVILEIERNKEEYLKSKSKIWRGRALQCKSSAIIVMDEFIKIIENMIINEGLY